MNIFFKIDELVDLTENEKILVEFIKSKRFEFAELEVEDICNQCFVSKSTIYRLCKKLNLIGLSQLKVAVSAGVKDYVQEQVDYDFPIKSNQTQTEVLDSLKTIYRSTINSTYNLMDLQELNYIALQLKKANVIDIYTSAGNIFFAESFKFQMAEIGVNINVPEEEYLQHLTASTSDKSHVAIVISFGGRGRCTSSIIGLLKEKKTPIILVTSTDDNPLKKYAKHILYMSSFENHFNKISSFSTRLSLLYILDVIYGCYFKLDYDKNIKYKTDTYKRMRKYPKDYEC
ncbi:MurR/RpiR family transcriptional regulator [Clostridium butyricum]|uniref:MurR/RpiR family transcriptional regulator n=1 Tax=Clostridium butyricum TaxID=1492 RepID=UPI0009036F99|nr:MurR/RpiR family transcriptional regulator [Clostridium butyricum]APF21298.1 SIS domain protein [Clostridium butyricum]